MTKSNYINARSLTAAGLLAVATLSAVALYARSGSDRPTLLTETVTRGAIVNSVTATGVLEAVTTVEVGAELSGTLDAIYVDYNSMVKKGQVLARLEQSLFQSAVEEAKANLLKAQADADRMKLQVADAATKLDRTRVLSDRDLVPLTELEEADVTRKSNQADLQVAAAQVSEARAALEQAQTNLQKTVITSPIDGIVISRQVDVGQTVASRMTAPVLFVIAADLREMQVKASIDEADVSRLREGQSVAFDVDAFQNAGFTGTLQQLRLSPLTGGVASTIGTTGAASSSGTTGTTSATTPATSTNAQSQSPSSANAALSGVVTYAAIVTAPNPDLRLKPGMTATLNVESQRVDDVLRVPTAALRFKPTLDVQKAFKVDESAMKVAQAAPKDSQTEGLVWVFDTTLRPVRVQIGTTDGRMTELRSAELPDGAQVVTNVMLQD